MLFRMLSAILNFSFSGPVLLEPPRYVPCEGLSLLRYGTQLCSGGISAHGESALGPFVPGTQYLGNRLRSVATHGPSSPCR